MVSNYCMRLRTFNRWTLVVAWKPFLESSTYRKKEFGNGCLITGFSTIYIICHLVILANPEVASCSGLFVESVRRPRSAPPFPLTWEYTFDTGEPLKKYFELDSISKKKIFPEEGLELGEKYQIYYEKHTKIIVKIDHLTK